VKCEDDIDRVNLRLRWFDEGGSEISTAFEVVIPGADWSEPFIWHRAPEQATSVTVGLAGRRCLFDKAVFYRMSEISPALSQAAN
jgi:hypothetical protein